MNTGMKNLVEILQANMNCANADKISTEASSQYNDTGYFASLIWGMGCGGLSLFYGLNNNVTCFWPKNSSSGCTFSRKFETPLKASSIAIFFQTYGQAINENGVKVDYTAYADITLKLNGNVVFQRTVSKASNVSSWAYAEASGGFLFDEIDIKVWSGSANATEYHWHPAVMLFILIRVAGTN